MKTHPIAYAIGFSRVLGLTEAVALGLSISLGLGLFALFPIVLQLAGSLSPLAYLLAIALFLPLLLSYVERAQEAPGSASCYQLARMEGKPWVVFLTGWLMLAGHIAVAGLFADSVSLRLYSIVNQLFNCDLPKVFLPIGVISFAGIHELFKSGNRSFLRNLLVWISFFIFLFILVWLVYNRPQQITLLPDTVATPNWLSSVAILAASLWGLEAVFSARRQLRNAHRNLLSASLLVLLMISVSGAAAAYLLLQQQSDLLTNKWLGDLSWDSSRINFALLFTGIVLCWIGLSRILVSAVRLLGGMLNDGFFPRFNDQPGTFKSSLWKGLILITFIIAFTLANVSAIEMAAIAAITYLWSFVLVMIPHIKQTQFELSARHSLRLPLHPLVPIIACVIAVYLSVLLPISILLGSCAWIICGIIYFRLYGYRDNLELQRKQTLVGDEETLPQKSVFRVLVAVKLSSEYTSLIQIGAALAHAHDGELLVVHCKRASKLWPAELVRKLAEKDWNILNENLSAIECTATAVHPLIRIAPDAAAGILETASEYKVDFILMGAPTEEDDPDDAHKSVVERVFHRTTCNVVILKGKFTKTLHKILVASTGHSDMTAALQFSQALAVESTAAITLLSDSQEEEAQPKLIKANEMTEREINIQRKILEVTDLKRSIHEEAADYDILIMGAAVDPNINQAVLEGIPVELAKGRKQQPTVIVKSTAAIGIRWLRMISWWLGEILPGLNIAERIQVFAEMRQAAKTSVDFYMLIWLSSAIATLGLILNSAAVIIGAMLVAPLMNPILAMANGIVAGNFHLLRRASKSSLNGIWTAIAVATAFTIVLPVNEPTNEILTRTEPNIFDLLVALAAGAAAAYAICRKNLASALPGVAIAVALVPPLCVVGFGLGTARFPIAGGALLLFATNFAAIIIAGAVIFYLLGFRPSRAKSGTFAVRAMVYAVIGLLILTIPLGFATRKSIERYRIDTLLISQFAKISPKQDYRIQEISIDRSEDKYQIEMTIYLYAKTSGIERRIAKLKKFLEQETESAVNIRVTVLRATEIVKD
jgi:uncharacterized hydrophobic protein (TIGR00271 family)